MLSFIEAVRWSIAIMRRSISSSWDSRWDFGWVFVPFILSAPRGDRLNIAERIQATDSGLTAAHGFCDLALGSSALEQQQHEQPLDLFQLFHDHLLRIILLIFFLAHNRHL